MAAASPSSACRRKSRALSRYQSTAHQSLANRNLNYFTFIEDTKTLKYLHIDPDVACDLPRGFLYDDDSTAEVRRFLVAGSPGQKPTPVLDQRPGGRTAMRALCRTVLADGPATFPVKSYAIDAFDNTMDELKTEGIESGHLGALLAVFFHFEGERDVLLRKIHEKNFVWFNCEPCRYERIL